MGQRRALVIGSQCKPYGDLPFLPDYAQDLYTVLTKPKIGGCTSALGDETGLLIDPTVKEVEDTIERTFQLASRAGDTLLLALVGHGWGKDRTFYFLATDSPRPPTLRTAVPLADLLRDTWGRHSGIDGLLLLIDTCHAGIAGLDTASELEGALKSAARYEILMATGEDSAYGGCFTHVLVETLRKGLPAEKGETVLCRHVSPILDQKCIEKQVSDHRARKPSDESMFLAKNIAPPPANRPWERMSLSETLDALTDCFQPTAALTALVARAETVRCAALVGGAGKWEIGIGGRLGAPGYHRRAGARALRTGDRSDYAGR